MTWIMVIVIGGQAFLSYDLFQSYEACDEARNLIAGETYVASCMNIDSIDGPPEEDRP